LARLQTQKRRALGLLRLAALNDHGCGPYSARQNDR
jgi:hypothetical protein